MKGLVGFLLAVGALGAGLYGVTRGGREPVLSGSRRRRSRGFRGHGEQRELKIFIDNDGDLYRQQTTPIHKNLVTKIAKGVYDKTKAEKLWGYLVEAGAKKYSKEYGSNEPGEWHRTFSVADRREVARELNEEFLTEQKLGNFDHLLPKKYQRA
ncbi:MAG TPA: hypothetical protein VGY48_15310 [Vicinamibacterales bacterium]|nr:hypothetical protein [Vicinamibacterales bacterium]